MGKNKLAKFDEIETFEHVIQVPFRDIKHTDFYLKGKWAKDFFKNDNPIILELGCGKGEYAFALAEKYPENNFIGVDIKGSRMWEGAKKAYVKGLKNIAFLRTHIEMISQFFAEGEVAEIWLTFPDPQMKKARKRLTSTIFLNKYRKFLQPGGIVHLKTDSQFQYKYTAIMAKFNNFEILAETDNLYEWEYLTEMLQVKTFYERQWLERGITIKYLSFKLHKKEFNEPNIEIKFDEYRSYGRSARS